MNKYYEELNNSYDNIERQLMPDESIIWKGKPKKSAFVINASIKMMPIALLWLAFDSMFLGGFFKGGGLGTMGWFFILFFAFHLMPVWIWLSQMLTAGKRWKNTEYAITDRRILLRNGLIGYQYESIYYKDIANVSLRVGAIDKMLKVGDICIYQNAYSSGNSAMASILDVEDVERVFAIVQKTVMDIQTDIHYPNALRPDNNPGYKTQYRP